MKMPSSEGLGIWCLLVLRRLHEAGGEAGETLEFGGDDDLGGLTVGDLLHGFKSLELDDLIVGASLVQHPHGFAVAFCTARMASRTVLRSELCLEAEGAKLQELNL